MKKPEMHPLEAGRGKTIEDLGLNLPTIEESYDAIVGLLADALEVPICLFSVVHEDRQFFKANVGLPATETPRDISFCGHAIVQDDDVLVVENAMDDPRFSDNPLVTGAPDIRFYAGAVIMAPNNLPVGTVCAIDTKARKLSAADRQHLMRAKFLMEAAISMHSLSVRDHLTGLYNRRYFDHYFAEEWRRAYRHTMPLSVLLFDVDNFKNYNDQLGHAAGDQCLRQIATAAKGALARAGDLIARYGGEEFVVVLPATDAEAAGVIANRLRLAIRGLGIENPGAAGGVVTVSIGGGIAASKVHMVRGAEAVLAVADEALYEAKGAGRDRCVIRTMQNSTG